MSPPLKIIYFDIIAYIFAKIINYCKIFRGKGITYINVLHKIQNECNLYIL